MGLARQKALWRLLTSANGAPKSLFFFLPREDAFRSTFGVRGNGKLNTGLSEPGWGSLAPGAALLLLGTPGSEGSSDHCIFTCPPIAQHCEQHCEEQVIDRGAEHGQEDKWVEWVIQKMEERKTIIHLAR